MNKQKEETISKADDRHIWEQLEQQKNEVVDGYNGKILHVIEISNESYFGGDSYSKKNGLKIVCEVETNETFDQWYSIPSMRYMEKSNLGLFRKKYGSFPKPKLEVRVVIDDNGFYKINLD